ncbi:LCP family protein [Neobacillus terrae]|uniref:LCP family glycopolymer transferase n=1 Tax=Neobacillus terrae TaxID=3034837 RepID=UPI001407EED4|nr:LCP family protein [Neobacillus terrae]NHM29989.1 LytR family transcriptional regulator [Neobacillus terrae]
MNTRLSRKGKRKRKLRVFRVFFLALFIAIIGAGIYFYNIYSDVAGAVNKMNNSFDLKVSKKRSEKVEFHRKDPISILLVGVDERKGDSGRTDSMIIATINPETKSTKLLSIPRDTRTKLVNNSNSKKDRISKINAAYAYGGIEETIDTVENFLNIPIDYYAQINMEGFKDIVNAVGGIDVNNKYKFELDGVTLKPGEQHLNGEKALQYARMRHQDPLGDFGRQERQKEVIIKVVDKGKKFNSLVHYKKILNALEDNIKTNLSLDDMIGIQSNYKVAANNIEKMEVKGEGESIPDDGWYYIVTNETRQELSDKLRKHLGLPEEKVSPIYTGE